jgi:hypothetical protein
MDGASGSESIAVGFEPCFPFGLKDEFDEGLECPIVERGDVISRLHILSSLL